ncbi:pilus assembly PilX family protein [Dasania marina]|uniref:pilus assembly PilX family protein n=1 Tax=Dasania marina TaxID=471499 RepID=UPI0003638E7F|nr:PilX N-terminal domain-containing pilus assembly protein [Dasania marina]
MKHRQSGSVLLFSLMILFILSLVGVASMDNVTLNERMASNYREHDFVFQAAEAALAEGENAASNYTLAFNAADIQTGCSGASCFTSTCANGFCFNGSYPSGGVCTETQLATPLWLQSVTWTTAGRARESIANFPTLPTKPKYIIEFVCYVVADPNAGTPTAAPTYDSSWAKMYRITAYAEGPTGGSRAMVQSTFKQ